MKWYKHQTDSHNDEGLAEVLHEFGLEGYGFWWLLQEIVGKSMDASDRCDLSYPLATWARKLQCSKRKTSTFFEKFSEISLIILDFDKGNENNSVGKLKISIPNLLKTRDEYSKKSGQTPDKKGKVSGAKIEIKKEIEIKEEPKNLSPSGDEEQPQDEAFILTKKKRKLVGKRMETFLTFWEAFGYKSGKAEAADSWLDIPQLTGSLVAKIVEAAGKEALARPSIRARGSTPKMAQGWLTARRWEDENREVEPTRKRGLSDGDERAFLEAG